jgi:very-short-patch-repair endonuclease
VAQAVEAFEDDHARELEFHAHGHTFRRFTYRQVVETPQGVATSVREALQRSVPSPS